MFYGLWKREAGNGGTISEEEGGRNRCGDRAESSDFLGAGDVHTYICLKDFRKKERGKQMTDKERGKQMTDKEQMVIDGVDVSGCEYLQYKGCEFAQCLIKMASFDLKCENYNCYFKQLARKTQECEELKAYAQRQENQREEYYKEYLKKDKALEEIKKLKKELDLYKAWYRAKHGDIRNLLGSYRKALMKIKYEATEEIKNLEADADAYGCFMEILNIIDKAERGLTTR